MIPLYDPIGTVTAESIDLETFLLATDDDAVLVWHPSREAYQVATPAEDGSAPADGFESRIFEVVGSIRQADGMSTSGVAMALKPGYIAVDRVGRSVDIATPDPDHGPVHD